MLWHTTTRNLCAHRWIQQFKGKKVSFGGTRDQFKAYWNSLGKVKQRMYEDEADALVSSMIPIIRELLRVIYRSRRAIGGSPNWRKHYSSSNKIPFNLSAHVLSQLLLRFQVCCPTVSSTISRPFFPFRAHCPIISSARFHHHS
ncbi:hypothetical protein PAXRUDRAFT_830204, partial [Paxillus rubicundulus Ve08.2h10]